MTPGENIARLRAQGLSLPPQKADRSGGSVRFVFSDVRRQEISSVMVSPRRMEFMTCFPASVFI